jgi:hypothetical protein
MDNLKQENALKVVELRDKINELKSQNDALTGIL